MLRIGSRVIMQALNPEILNVVFNHSRGARGVDHGSAGEAESTAIRPQNFETLTFAT